MPKAKAPLISSIILASTMGVHPSIAAEATGFTMYSENTSRCTDECVVDFGVVPEKHDYEIRFISCRARTSNNVSLFGWTFMARKLGKGIDSTAELRPVIVSSGANMFYVATENVLLFVPAGRRMTVTLLRFGTQGFISSLECTISGYDTARGR